MCKDHLICHAVERRDFKQRHTANQKTMMTHFLVFPHKNPLGLFQELKNFYLDWEIFGCMKQKPLESSDAVRTMY